MTRRFIVDLIDSDETDRFVGKYGADEITNMTNGEVIKALFKIDYIINEYLEVGLAIPVGRQLQKIMGIDRSWWNAPYKSESDKSADTFEKLLNSGFYERFRKGDEDADCD